MGSDQARSKFEAMCQILFRRRIETPSAQMLGKEEGRRNSEDKQEQGKASQQLVLPASSGFNEGTPASVWSLIFLVFGVHMGNAEEQGIQVQQRIEKDLCQILSRLPMEEGALLGDL